MDIGKTINKYKRLNFVKIITKILNSSRTRKYIIFLEQERLLTTGKDSEGESLGEYSPVTVVIKQEKGQRTDHITLLDTGAFYKDESGEESNLFDDFGIDVLGLNDDDTEKVIEYIYIELRRFLLHEL